LSTVGRFIYPKCWETFCWTLLEDLFTQNTRKDFAKHCWKIYLHKILANTLCWTLLEDLFTQNTGKYFMLNTVRRFIYTKD
jgi:hypothetical protein